MHGIYFAPSYFGAINIPRARDNTVESHQYVPLFCMLASGKTGEGAYVRECDISVWRPLPTDDHHVDPQSLYFYWLFERKNGKVSFDTTGF